MDWLLPFLEDMGRLEAFDNIWKNVPPYTSFTHPTKAYRQVTQWNGKEMRSLGHIILVVFAASLRRTAGCTKLTPIELQSANKAI